MVSNAHKLPVFNTVWTAVMLPFAYRRVFLRVAFVVFPLFVLGQIMIPGAVTSTHRDQWEWGVLGISFTAITFMAVAWHRLVILGKRHPDWVHILRRAPLYFIALALMTPGMDIVFGMMDVDRPTVMITAIALTSQLLYVLVLIALISLILPMLATGRGAPSLNNLVLLLSGNWFRFLGCLLIGEGLAWLLIFVLLPIVRSITWDAFLAALDIKLAGPGKVDQLMLIAVSLPTALMHALIFIYVTAFGAGLLSLAYVRLKNNLS